MFWEAYEFRIEKPDPGARLRWDCEPHTRLDGGAIQLTSEWQGTPGYRGNNTRYHAIIPPEGAEVRVATNRRTFSRGVLVTPIDYGPKITELWKEAGSNAAGYEFRIAEISRPPTKPLLWAIVQTPPLPPNPAGSVLKPPAAQPRAALTSVSGSTNDRVTGVMTLSENWQRLSPPKGQRLRFGAIRGKVQGRLVLIDGTTGPIFEFSTQRPPPPDDLTIDDPAYGNWTAYDFRAAGESPPTRDAELKWEYAQGKRVAYGTMRIFKDWQRIERSGVYRTFVKFPAGEVEVRLVMPTKNSPPSVAVTDNNQSYLKILQKDYPSYQALEFRAMRSTAVPTGLLFWSHRRD